jgi:hypothetical protein
MSWKHFLLSGNMLQALFESSSITSESHLLM